MDPHAFQKQDNRAVCGQNGVVQLGLSLGGTQDLKVACALYPSPSPSS